ncbi:PD-(D/E)XK nuclease family protein, partial [bacterium]
EDEYKRDSFFNQGKNIIEKYYHDNDITASTPIATEMFFETSIDVSNEVHTLAGKIDRIDKLSDGSFEIIDYKTSKWLPSQDDVDNNLQLAIYQMGLLNRWPNIDTPIKVSLYFLLHGMKLSSTKSPDTTATKEKVSNMIKSIQDTKEFKPLPSVLCGWCGHQKICPMFSHKFRVEEKKEDIDIKTAMKDFFEIKEQESDNKKQLAELKEKINKYCDTQKVERVFADDGSSITRSVQKRFGYNWDIVSDILKKNNKWEEVYSVDKAKLKTVMPTLSSADFEKIEKTKKLESEYTVLSIKN